MITRVLTKIFGSRNDRLLKQYARTVARINQLESGTAAFQVTGPATGQLHQVDAALLSHRSSPRAAT